ncbi:MAG: hypothetical protein JWP63_5192 [Candidatus Solibacter sp.]|nr:hypothetical protein [Candidatus Solibacter sp.]
MAAVWVGARTVSGEFLGDFAANPELKGGPAADLWRKTLSRIPTHFGRLVFMASLRDSLTGKYAHPALLEIVGREITDRTLCHGHHHVFAEWLNFTLSEQKADLDDYLTSSQAPLETLPYRELPPSTAHQVERQLYLTDLETLLELLRYEHGGAFSLPEA